MTAAQRFEEAKAKAKNASTDISYESYVKLVKDEAEAYRDMVARFHLNPANFSWEE